MPLNSPCLTTPIRNFSKESILFKIFAILPLSPRSCPEKVTYQNSDTATEFLLSYCPNTQLFKEFFFENDVNLKDAIHDLSLRKLSK